MKESDKCHSERLMTFKGDNRCARRKIENNVYIQIYIY